MHFVAVVTAGARVDGAFAHAIGTDVKALAPFGGTTVLHRTIEALQGLGVERIAVVGGSQVRDECADRVEKVVEESRSGAENLRRALYAFDEALPLLYLTSDMPFISADALQAFVNAVPENTLALPLTEWNDFAARFPGAPPFGVRLAGERVVNGGAFVLPAHTASIVERFARELFEARKSPWRMARLTGPTLLLRFLFGRLTIAQIENRAERTLHVRARAVRAAPPELAYDIDTLDEYRYAAAQS